MGIIIAVIFVALFLGYANGANDNFKGVATLWGSSTTNYRKALCWATITTFLGSLAAIFLSTRLITAFSGKGLVPEAIATDPLFLVSVGAGAASTVFIATVIGIPLSTTHALVGALLGAGFVSAGAHVNVPVLGNKFLLPLLVSPTIAAVLTVIIYPCFRFARLRLRVERQICLCVGKHIEPVYMQQDGTAVLQSSGVTLEVDQVQHCRNYYQGRIFCFDAQALLDKLHYLSSGLLSFARGLNDTPKIVPLLLVMSAFPANWAIVAVAFVMAAGGIAHARKVALTMSKRITTMNHGQGFSANIVAAFLVILASKWGLPVSTTHVACGSLFGIGVVNRNANMSVVRHIVLAWVLTLPLAALLSGTCFVLMRHLA